MEEWFFSQKEAGVDILPQFVDYKKKRQASRSYFTNYIGRNKGKLTKFYKDIQGKYPEKFNTNMK